MFLPYPDVDHILALISACNCFSLSMSVFVAGHPIPSPSVWFGFGIIWKWTCEQQSQHSCPRSLYVPFLSSTTRVRPSAPCLPPLSLFPFPLTAQWPPYSHPPHHCRKLHMLLCSGTLYPVPTSSNWPLPSPATPLLQSAHKHRPPQYPGIENTVLT